MALPDQGGPVEVSLSGVEKSSHLIGVHFYSYISTVKAQREEVNM